MASEQRQENLIAFCKQWKDSLEHAENHRDNLIELQNKGMLSIDDNGEDLIPIMIKEADKAALIYKNILTRMETLRDRAISGEDV